MQTHCKTEKPVFRSWCFGIRKAVPIAALSLGALFAASPVDAQTLGGVPYVNSWVGNTYGTPDDHIPHDIDNLYVTPSGKVATITIFDEGGANAALYSSSGGKIGIPVESGTGSWGKNSGKAVFANDTYLYQSMSQKGGYDADGTRYPVDPSTAWVCIRRYNQNGTSAPFTGGKGSDGSYLVVNTKTGVTADTNIRDMGTPTGVLVYNNELYVSDPIAGRVKVYNASTMSQTPVRTLTIANPGLLDYDRLGFIWMLDTVQKKLIRFSSTGAIQSQSITFPSNVVPTSFCVDKVNDRILVTNNGNDQNVLIYTGIFSMPSQTSTFGNTGGINSGVAGVIAPLKFSEPMGVGIDSSGNIFVGNNGLSGGGTRLEKYNSSGTLQWRLNGLVFTANGDLNPSNESEFYTFNHKFNLNLGNSTPGSEWSAAAMTVNKVKYPYDTRAPLSTFDAFWTTTYMRNVSGRKLMFISDMYGRELGIYRFNSATDGETAIPSGLFDTGALTETIWRDGNGNGNPDAGETASHEADNIYGTHIFPDANGGVWKANRGNVIRYYPMQGFDGNGNPQYTYASSIAYNHTELSDVRRLEYDAPNNVLYAIGNSPDNMTDDFAGDRMVRYNNMTGARSTAWSVSLPYGTNTDLYVKAFCEAGDYLFLIAAIDGRIYVHKKSDGSKVGEIMPTSATGSTNGWSDIQGAVRATKRSNGEYLIFAEENGNGKVMMYRWKPTPIATPTPTPTGGTIVNNTASGFTYTGGWGYDTNRGLGDYNNDLHYTQTNNDSVSYTFTGTGVDLIAEKNFDEGDVDIYIDNVFQATVSCYNASRLVQQRIWSTRLLSSGSHTIKVVKKSGSYMVIDALKIYTAAVTTTQVNNTASGITYTGGWGYDTNRGLGDYNDDLHYTQTNNDSVSYTFTGIGLTYVAEKNFDEGDVDIYIDNVFQATVSCYSASRMVQQGVWTTSNLTSGQHTFKAVKKTGSYMVLDALKIYSQ